MARHHSQAARSGRPRKAPATKPDEFWQSKGLDQLAADQAVPPAHLPDLLGEGADLWADDAELEAFLAAVADRRHKRE